MATTVEFGPEIVSLCKLIGLFDGGGNLDPNWFNDPLTRLESILSNPPQRDGLLQMLDALLPPDSAPELPAGDKWHPLLGAQPYGNLYLTVHDDGGGVLIGLAGEFGASGPTPTGKLVVRLPLIHSSGSTVTAIVGTSNGPFSLQLRVELGWSLPAQTIGLQAVAVAVNLTLLPPGSEATSIVVTLEQLQLDQNQPAQDMTLDPDHLGDQAMHLILGLIHENLSRLVGPTGEAAAVANHLLALFGIGNSIPPFPITEGATALRSWLSSLVAGGASAPIAAWLGHLAGLLGSSTPTASGSGTQADPWRVQVMPIGTGIGSGLDLTLAMSNGHGAALLMPGMQVTLVPSGGSPQAQMIARATIASMPLAGSASSAILPDAGVFLRAPGQSPAPNLISDANITIGALQAGLHWNGANLLPMLELDQVTFAGTHYDRLDLTNTESVVAAASSALQSAIRTALGGGPGAHLAALAGLIAPSSDPTSTHLVDPAQLVSNPARAISAVHRSVLLDSAHDWSHMLAEVGALAGLPGTVSGAGTFDDPWRISLGAAGPLDVSLAAWDSNAGASASDPHGLRLGLRLVAASAPLTFAWLAEALSFDLPATGAGTTHVLDAQHMRFKMQPVPAVPQVAGFGLSASSFDVNADWTPGSSIAWHAGVTNLALSVDGSTVTVPNLNFPPASGFDVSNPAATAASLGVPVADLEKLARLLVARASYSWGGMTGLTLTGLTGFHSALAGLPTNWPTLADPTTPGSLLSDPFAALKTWLGHVAVDTAPDGTAYLPSALGWFQALLSHSLPDAPSTGAPSFDLTGHGSGTYDDPWTLPLDDVDLPSAEALAWLEPAGPPPAWASNLIAQAAGVSDFPTLVTVIRALAPFLPALRDALAGYEPGLLAEALNELATHLAISDGVVPVTSQIPAGGTWTTGTPIAAPHHLQPQDPSAISQILAQVDTWSGGISGARAVVLLGPAFSDHHIWDALLASPNRHGAIDANAHFNLRLPGVDPTTIDLNDVTVVADYYTADLQDDGSGNLASLTAQINRIVARMRQLRPGVPVTIVAHSTAGVPARAFTASAPAGTVQGLITLGTPHLGAPLPFLTDPVMADAVRVAQSLLPADPGVDPTRQAIVHLVQALDGYVPPDAPGHLPTPLPYPVSSFNFTSASTDTAGRPALALGGPLSNSLLSVLKPAVGALANSAANPTTTPPAPTHLAFGFRTRLGYPVASAAQVAVEAFLRADLLRIALRDGVAEPPHPAQVIHLRAKLSRSNGWLVGASSAFAGSGLPPVDVRVRWAELGADVQFTGSTVQVTPHLALRQVALHGPMLPGADWADAQAQALLGAVLHAIAPDTPTPGTPVAALLADLQALGVAVPDPHGGMGISADAFAALATDAAGYLRPRLNAALDALNGLGGINGPAGGPWTLTTPTLPIQIALAKAPWKIHIRTTGLPLASNTQLAFDAGLSLPNLALSLDTSLSIGAFSLAYSQSSGQLSLQAPCLDALPLYPPPSATTLHAALNDLLPKLLFSGAASALLEAAGGPGLAVGPLHCFFDAPGKAVTKSSALGNGTGLDASKITQLLKAINRAIGMPAGPGLSLPSGLQLAASGAGTNVDPVRLALSTTAPIGGVLGVQLGLAFDSHLHPTPSGTLTLNVTGLPGTGTLPWTGLGVAFGASPSGVTLAITPTPGDPIQILPNFGGLGAIAGTAQALLPGALDAAVNALSTPGPRPELLTLALDVATALSVYDEAGKFSAHTTQLRALLHENWTTGLGLSTTAQGQVAAAIAGLFGGASPLAGAIPGSITASGQSVTWTFNLPGEVGSGTLAAILGWDGSGPTVTVGAQNVKLGNGALTCNLAAGYASGAIQCSTAVGLHLQQSLGLDVVPKLALSVSGGHFASTLLPLATGSGDGPMRVDLAPTPAVNFGAGGALGLVEGWLMPLVADLLFEATKSHLADALWSGGKTLEDALVAARLVDKGATPADDKLHQPFPDWVAMLTGLAQSLASSVSIPLSSTLHLAFVNDSGRLGVSLNGHQDIPTDSMVLSLRFGAPGSWGPHADEGLALYLFQSSGSSFSFQPGLRLAGVGLGLAGADDAPLVNTDVLRLGGVRGYLFLDVDFLPTLSATNLGAGAELVELGLPLGQATGGNAGGNNPVAASLLRHDSGSGGDSHAVNPGLDVEIWDIGSGFHITFGGQVGPLWIGVHAGFGPIYIDQVGLAITSDPGAGLLIDGSVKVDGLTAQVDELTVTVPFNALASPNHWSLDLKGLGVGFQSPGVDIAGALRKSDGPPVEYDGLLLVQLGQFGIIAIGAYSTPGTGADQYTSLFVFAGAFIPIGLPPVIEISGLGLGVGYNRELIVPDDLNKIPDFVLVAALDDPGKIADDPMGMLMQFRDSIPAKRGSFWLAVGLRGTSFEIVHVTAIVYVALDRGVEIGVLGVARMALPTDDTALVSVELALKARFSSAEGILSIQAQLTDNSWLLSRDCQLTGGFAYFMWFSKSQFVLTLGGYHPAFQRPPEFPTVPRLGYHWSLLGAISIKGESYFALTNTCVMAGARFEATYGPDWIQVWFTAYSDFLVSWDPFYYDVQIGIEVGARFRMEICFFGCVTIDISVSLGASLHISGPPLHGEVTVDLAVASVTVAFGPDPRPQPDYITDWNVFAVKYLYNGDPNGLATANHALTGLLPPEPAGGQPSPGTQAQPWKMTNEFSFQTETHMPAMRYNDFVFGDSGTLADAHSVAINPMGKENIASAHAVKLEGWDDLANQWVTMGPGATDARFRVDGDHFKIERIIGQVSEASWSYIDPANVPAAARTIPALVGLRITGMAVARGQSALIPIARLRDADRSRPLPFATELDLSTLHLYGQRAEDLIALAAGANNASTLNVAQAVLAGPGFFVEARQAAGLPTPGLPPMAVRSLAHYRSAPPLIGPITTGLTMKPVGQAAPPVIARVAEESAVALEQPRLRAVLQGRIVPAADAPPSLHTTVAQVAPRNAPRMAAPRLDVIAGAGLKRVAAPDAPRPTALGRAGRTLRSPEFGWSAGAAHSISLRQAESAVTLAGVVLAAGVTHVWDIPSGSVKGVTLRGRAGARVTFLTRGGQVISDVEFAPQEQATLLIPANCAMVAVTCLGKLPDGMSNIKRGLGTVSFTAAPSGRQTVCGWQNNNLVTQVGAATLLGRGAVIAIPRPHTPLRGKQATSQAIVRAGDALSDQTGVETWLPTSVNAVMILLDQQNPAAASDGDLALAVQGATLATSPLRVEGGQRVALIYDVTSPDQKADHVTISAASRSGWSVSGVIGLPGRAQEWAVRLNGGIPEHMVPDGPLTPDGELNVRLMMG